MKSVKRVWIIYLVLCIGLGIFQFIDMRVSLTPEPDPLWHVVFYFPVYPVLSVALGIFTAQMKRFWAVPFAAFALIALIAVLTLGVQTELDVSVLLAALPSFAGAWIGIAIGKLSAAIRREKEKMG